MEAEQMDLLDVPVQLSPRRAWFLQWDVYTSHLEPGTETMEGIVEEEDQWQARALGGSVKQYGETEEAALVNLAKELGVPFWNEADFSEELGRRSVIQEAGEAALAN